MKIVQIINSLRSRGGAEVFVVSLCEELSKRKNTQVIVVTLYEGIHKTFNEVLTRSGVLVKTISKKSSHDFKSSKRLRKLLLQLNPDIVNSHLSVPATYLFAFKNKKTPWKYFHTIHSDAYFDSNKLGKIAIKSLLKRNNISLIGISTKISKTIEKLYRVKPSFTIFNGVSISDFVFKKTKKEFDLICVASFRTEKNHKMLFDLVKEISTFCKIKLLCIGSGELFEKSMNYLDAINCRKFVVCPGAVEDVYKYLALSKIFILTSTVEGNPISILEAMNAGLPIIAPKIGGIPDVVVDGINGFTFGSNNFNEAKKCILHLLDNEQLIKKISIQNRIDVKKHSIRECCNKYLNAYKNKMD